MNENLIIVIIIIKNLHINMNQAQNNKQHWVVYGWL